MIYDSYVKAAINTLESQLSEEDKQLTRIAKAPLRGGYQPEFDLSEILGPDAANWFQNLIGILNWIVELGRVDINNSMARLSTFLSNPRAGHFQVDLHVFSNLKHYDISKRFLIQVCHATVETSRKAITGRSTIQMTMMSFRLTCQIRWYRQSKLYVLSTRITLVIIWLGARTLGFSLTLTMLPSTGTARSRTP